LRFTASALSPAQFLPSSFVPPPRPAAPVFASGAPNTISGLQFWLPAYTPANYFADIGYADPLPGTPASGTAARTAIDASSNHLPVSMVASGREVLYANDPQVGPNWLDVATLGEAGNQWVVPNSTGSSSTNFDFVQDTGVFTMTAFVKMGSGFGGNMTIFDTADVTTLNPGFTFQITPTGAPQLLVYGPNGNVRFSQTGPAGLLSPNLWYQIAVVGNGSGQTVTYYVTPVTASTVSAYTTNLTIAGANGSYPTDLSHNLSIGAITITGTGAFNGQMVDQAIYNRALTQAEIQQLFNYTKKSS
jgi:hypothetical protein